MATVTLTTAATGAGVSRGSIANSNRTLDHTKLVWALKVARWNPNTEGEDVRYYGTKPSLHKAWATLASSHFESARLVQPALVSRTAFDEHTTRGRGRHAVGQSVIDNGFGQLDQFHRYPVDGRAETLYMGMEGDDFPSGFRVMLDGTSDSEVIGQTASTLKMRDWQRGANVPVQTTVYDGSNVNGEGLQGTEDLKGKPVTVCIGSVFNITGVCVNPQKNIYQVHDGDCDSISDVRDSGISLSGGGTQWAAVTHTMSGVARDIASDGAGTVIAVGDSGGISRSTDYGLTFATCTSSITSALHGVRYFATASLWIVAGATAACYTSPTGASGTWTTRTSGFTADTIRAIDVSDTSVLLVGDAGKATRSTNGTSYSAVTSGFGSEDIYGATTRRTPLGVRRVIVGELSKVSYSDDDGATWTFAGAMSPLGAIWRDVAGGRREFIAVSEDGELWWSELGVVWSPLFMSFGTTDVQCIHFAQGQFVAGDAGGKLGTSTDGGQSFRIRATDSSRSYHGITFSGQYWLAVSQAGLIARAEAIQTYANATDLEDDTQAPSAGAFGVLLSPTGSYFRLGSPPFGKVTADVEQDASATAADVFAALLERGGYVSGVDYSASDITTLAAAAPGICGYYTDQGDRVMIADAADLAAQSAGAAWFGDANGVVRIKQLTAPATNIVTNPDDLNSSPWAAGGTAVVANDVANYAGRHFSRITGAVGGFVRQPVTLPSNGTYYLTAWIKSNGVAGTVSILDLFDSSTATDRSSVQAVIASDGTMTFTASLGTLIGSQSIGDGVYAVTVKATGAIAANTNFFYAMTGATGATSVLMSNGILIHGDPDARLTPIDGTSGNVQDLMPAMSADPNGGLAVPRSVVRYKKNYTPQNGMELAGGVSDTDRALYGKDYLDASTAEDADVVAAHPLAVARVEETLLLNESDAEDEADRRQALFGVERYWYDCTVLVTDETSQIELMDVVDVASSRFQMGAGTRHRVLGIKPNAGRGEIVLQLWR